MIERMDATCIPIQQRTVVQQEIRVNMVTNEENLFQADLSENQQQKGENLKKENVEEIVKSLNDFLEPSHTSLKFQFHEKLNEYYVTIVDDNTHEVIKEIPPKRLLDIYAAMAERLGFLIDKKV